MAPMPAPRPSEPTWRATGLEAPVFLDTTGRRRRVVAGLGALLASTTAAWLVALLLGGSGFGALPPAVVPSAFRAHVTHEVRLSARSVRVDVAQRARHRRDELRRS
jgi:hypothetical protein